MKTKLTIVGSAILIIVLCGLLSTYRPGTYHFEASADTILIDVTTLQGGPTVSWTLNPDGSRTLTVEPHKPINIGETLKLLDTMGD